jgi:nanoRNase/pAp phosphatase (c-di-AMP/oligoRNAs hydrolase)
MRNPWLNFESFHLGEFMRRFGGGGHQRVGSVVLPAEQNEEAGNIWRKLLQELNPVGADKKNG